MINPLVRVSCGDFGRGWYRGKDCEGGRLRRRLETGNRRNDKQTYFLFSRFLWFFETCQVAFQGVFPLAGCKVTSS